MVKKHASHSVDLALVGLIGLVALVGIVTIISGTRGAHLASADAGTIAGDAAESWQVPVASLYEGYLVRGGQTAYVLVNTVDNVISVDDSTFSVKRRGYTLAGSWVQQGKTIRVTGNLRPGTQVLTFSFNEKSQVQVGLRAIEDRTSDNGGPGR